MSAPRAHRSAPVAAGRIEQVDARDLDPLDVLGREHGRGAELPVDRGDVEGGVVEEPLGDALDVGRLDAEVELLLQGAGELLDDLDRPVENELLHVAFGQGRQVQHDLEVHLDDRADARPAHLDGDFLAAFQARAVHLGDRGRGDRVGVDLLEELRDRGAQLLLEDGLRFGKGEGGDAVLELGELVDELERDQVGAGRQHLPQLDVGRPELLDRHAHALRPREPLFARLRACG